MVLAYDKGKPELILQIIFLCIPLVCLSEMHLKVAQIFFFFLAAVATLISPIVGIRYVDHYFDDCLYSECKDNIIALRWQPVLTGLDAV